MYKPTRLFDFIDLMIRFSYILIILLLVLGIIAAVVLTSSDEAAFIVTEKSPYVIVNNYGNTPYFTTIIDKKYFNGTALKIESHAKQAVLIKIYFYSLPTLLTILVCSHLLKKVIHDLFIHAKKFNLNQVKYLKLISIIIALYFLFSDAIMQLVFSHWLGHMMLSNKNIHISGLLYAGLVYLLAEIFRYGAFLQESYDTTL